MSEPEDLFAQTAPHGVRLKGRLRYDRETRTIVGESMSKPNWSPDAAGLFRSWLRHRAYLREALESLSRNLSRRATLHDLSKLMDDEFEGFCRINAAARIQKFGSPEYAEGMRREGPTINLHFSRNSHHSEYGGQSWLDIVEMVCDWWAARQGYADNTKTWGETVALNLEHKGKYLTPEQRWLVAQVAQTLGRQEASDG